MSEPTQAVGAPLDAPVRPPARYPHLATRAELEAEIERLQADNQKLRTVMIAAAEEIHAHWDAHCDAEGYGPVNLMRRLEEGIPSEYGYTAGAFEAFRADALRFRWLAKRTAATGLERWVHPFQFLAEAVDERVKAGATRCD